MKSLEKLDQDISQLSGAVTAMCGRSKLVSYEGLEIWLGGLDSNQDSQIQNLKSCQLDDLPTGLLEDLWSHLV
jgi:hypothetical protein